MIESFTARSRRLDGYRQILLNLRLPYERGQAPRPEFQLTPVLPIVFHTGPRPWNAPRTLAKLVGGPEGFRPFVPLYQPLFWVLALALLWTVGLAGGAIVL